MTPDRALHRDSREDIEGLAHRGRIRLPEVILPDGSASPDQVATVPPGVDLAKAFLPWRELPGPPSGGMGAAIVGTREPDIGPWLAGAGTALSLDAGPPYITRPQSRDEILTWLYDLTGVRYAPAAFWRVAGWEIGWLAHWLDRLFTGGAMGKLIVVERQAAAAVRAAWLALKADAASGSPLIDTGVLLAARAVIDMLVALDRVIGAASHDPQVQAKWPAVLDAQAAIIQRLRSFVRAIEDAAGDRMLAVDRERKIGHALDHARDIVESIGLFTAVGDAIGESVLRITGALPTKGRKPPPLDTTFATELVDFSNRLEAAIAAGPEPAEPKRWDTETTGDLTRLYDTSPQARGAALARVRTDLIYKLVATRRLDRLFEALPWVAAPSGAFRLTFGGPLGAIAAVFEIARHREIAVEQVHRTREPVAGGRLDTTRGKQVYGDPSQALSALGSNSRAGFWLASSALSHHMIKALLDGRSFDARHPLPTLQTGRLSWDFEHAMYDPATMTTVTETELAKSVYATADYHRDLPRYMGLVVGDVLTAGLADVFPGELRGPGFNRFTSAADAQRRNLKVGGNPFAGDSATAAHRELLRSILKSLDEPTDGNDAAWRTASVVTRTPATHELRRFDERNVSHTGDRGDAGGRIRRRAAEIRKAQKDPGMTLRRMVDRARSWTDTSDDQPLAGVLSGRLRLTAVTPVAQTGIPAIWFCPGIDTPVHDWIAHGAPMWQPLALSNIVHAGLIAREVQAVGDAMPVLFGMPIPTALRRRILVPFWTGLAGITDDHAHVP